MESVQTFDATTEGLANCQAFLAEVCEDPKPQIIMDEIVSNIVRCSGAKAFTVTLGQKDPEGLVEMTFSDDGIAFDPTREIAAPDLNASAADRPIGGLGMFLVRKMSKGVSYRRDGEKNILSVKL